MSATKPQAVKSSWPRLLAALLVISAALFVAGVVLERAAPSGETYTGAPPVATQAAATHVEGSNESGETGTQATSSAPQPEAQGETTLGLNLENPWLVAGFVVASLLLAAAVLRLGWPALLLAFLFGAGAALFDLQELVVQLGRGNSLVTGFAVPVGVAHLAIAVLAVVAWAGARAAPTGLMTNAG